MTDDRSPYEVWTSVQHLREFDVRPEHIALLRRARSAWEGHKETGAPGLDRRRPFGSDDVYDDIAAIVDGGSGGEADELRHVRLFGELGLVLEIVLQSGRFAPGRYLKPSLEEAWRPAATLGGSRQRPVVWRERCRAAAAAAGDRSPSPPGSLPSADRGRTVTHSNRQAKGDRHGR